MVYCERVCNMYFLQGLTRVSMYLYLWRTVCEMYITSGVLFVFGIVNCVLNSGVVYLWHTIQCGVLYSVNSKLLEGVENMVNIGLLHCK